MSIWKSLFKKKQEKKETTLPDKVQEIKNENESSAPEIIPEIIPESLHSNNKVEKAPEMKTVDKSKPGKRSIRVFISSTFRDMMEERDALMTHCWPELRRFCRERYVELVEVDLRWGISEAQSTRKETLKLCLDEIRACRPFFVGLLGERYGWVPGEEAFTADLKEEQPWIKELQGKSVTELEILHGVLNNPEMAGRSFFYFRDPAYSKKKGADYLAESPADAEKQKALKNKIRLTCGEKNILLNENYPDPHTLALLVLEQLKEAIGNQFPLEDIPDPLDREANGHEAFAEIRRKTYIGRPEYFQALDEYISGSGKPLLLMGDSGSGKSALLANWIARIRETNPNDFIFQHYIGSTPDSAIHWKLMTRLMAEIKRWTNDIEDLPRTNDNILRDFALWLSKARIKAEHEGVRFVVVLDAFNQLEDTDHGRLLGWLPEQPFTGTLRLIASTLPGETQDVLEQRKWQTLSIKSLTNDERSKMIIDYLGRFSKKLDVPRLERLSAAPAAANPLYLKILLDELRVTGTYEKLDERLNDYLVAKDIPALLGKIFARYQRDYEHDRKGLVGDALGLIWAARRGLSEAELLQLLKPTQLPQLPLATWAPLRAALEEGLVDRGGILNFAHDFIRTAVETAFIPNLDKKDDLRINLADYFEAQSQTNRTCDELPWLLWQTELFDRLRNCLLNIDNFLLIFKRNMDELHQYWVDLGNETSMGEPYLYSFRSWEKNNNLTDTNISYAANILAYFLSFKLAIYKEAEFLFERALNINEKSFGLNHPEIATILNNLAMLLKETNRLKEAEPLLERALRIYEKSYNPDHPNVAMSLNNLAMLLKDTNRLKEAEPLLERALKIYEDSYGPNHPNVAASLNNLGLLLHDANRLKEAESLYKRSIKIDEESFGPDHPKIAIRLNNLGILIQDANRWKEAEPLFKRAITINERSYGHDHPEVATTLNNLAFLLKATNRSKEAEPLFERALKIDEKSYGSDHPKVARDLNNLATLLHNTNRMKEAELLMKRALRIDEKSYGPDHSEVANKLNTLAGLLCDNNRLKEAEPLLERALRIYEKSYGPDHPKVATTLNNLAFMFKATNRLKESEPLFERALKIYEDSYGPNHPHVAASLNNLGLLLRETNRLREAEPLVERALRIDEDSYGPNHPRVAASLNNLGLILQETNRLKEAEPLYERALRIKEKSYGPDHPDVAISLDNLANLLKHIGRLNEAESLIERALRINEKSYGPDHPQVATSLNSLAGFLYDTKRFNEAESIALRVVEILVSFYRKTGHVHPHLQKTIDNYTGLLHIIGWSEEQVIIKLKKIAPEFFK